MNLDWLKIELKDKKIYDENLEEKNKENKLLKVVFEVIFDKIVYKDKVFEVVSIYVQEVILDHMAYPKVKVILKIESILVNPESSNVDKVEIDLKKGLEDKINQKNMFVFKIGI